MMTNSIEFIIGLPKALSLKNISNKLVSKGEGSLWKKGKLDSEILEKHNMHYYKDEEIWSNERIALRKAKKSQVLNPRGMNLSYPLALVWIGDLDGDNEDDYIIHYGEKDGQTILYLSSAAEDGQIVKPVAVFYSGYCC